MSKGIVEQIVYTCEYCNLPVVHDTKESAEEHVKQCVFSVENKSCITCKHLELIIDYPAKRRDRKYKNEQLHHALGDNTVGRCMKYDKYLDSKEYFNFKGHDECYEYTKEPAEKVFTQKYKDFLEKSNKVWSDYSKEVKEYNTKNEG